MLKKIILALALTTFATTSAFAATKAAKTPPATHKVAQAGETKPADSKAKKEKKAKKATETPAEPAQK
jgi:hypothetical protein